MSFCELSWGDRLEVVDTIKDAFLDATYDTFAGILSTASECYIEHTCPAGTVLNQIILMLCLLMRGQEVKMENFFFPAN